MLYTNPVTKINFWWRRKEYQSLQNDTTYTATTRLACFRKGKERMFLLTGGICERSANFIVGISSRGD